MVAACRDCGINLIPDMNLLGHQTVQDYVDPDGLLRSHPEFSETPITEAPEYSYSLCPNAPGLFELLCDLMDEIADVSNGMVLFRDETPREISSILNFTLAVYDAEHASLYYIEYNS